MPRIPSLNPCRPNNNRITAVDSATHIHSKVISALDALDINDSGESDIEVLGPCPRASAANLRPKRKANTFNTRHVGRRELVHPMFLSKPALTSDLTNVAPSFRKIKSTPVIDSQYSILPHKPTTVVHKGTNSTKQAGEQQATPDIQTYSYKDYTKPKPFLVFTRDESEADDLVASLKSGPVALDMEWCFFYTRKNSASKVREHRTAVVQIADTAGLILVIQIYNMGRFPKALQALIEDPNVPKMGVNVLNDGRKLLRDYGILPKFLVELGALAQIADPQGARTRKIVSLAKLVEQYTSKNLEKGKERTSNWEAELDSKQLEYAANDVHSTITIYKRLLTLAQQHDILLTDSVLKSCSSNITMDLASPISDSLPSPPLPPSSAPPSRSLSTSSTTSSTSSIDHTQSSQSSQTLPTRPQYLRAYQYWHHKGMSMDRMRAELSLKGKGTVEGTLGEGLKAGTVVSYVIGALQADSTLPFEMKKLRELVQMDAGSWIRHREWVWRLWSERRASGEVEEW